MRGGVVLLALAAMVRGYRGIRPAIRSWPRAEQRSQRSVRREAGGDPGVSLEGFQVISRTLNIKPALQVTAYAIADSDQERIMEEAEAANTDPFGGRLWPSALAAAIDLSDIAYVVRNGSLSDLRVLELGAGIGVPSLTAAALGADTRATDITELSLSLLAKGAAQQDFEGAMETQLLDIMDEDQALPSCDLIISADMLYSIKLAEALAARCAEAYHRDGAGIIVTSPPGRVGEGRFLAALDKAGIPHTGFNDAILPTWADKLWEKGSVDSVVGLLRVLPDRLLGSSSDEVSALAKLSSVLLLSMAPLSLAGQLCGYSHTNAAPSLVSALAPFLLLDLHAGSLANSQKFATTEPLQMIADAFCSQ